MDMGEQTKKIASS